MGFVVFWLLCGVVSAMIGEKKGEGCLGFFFGLLLGPIGIVIALLSKGNRKVCPFCKELINRDATVCPKCQRDQGPGAATPPSGPTDED